MNKEFKSYLAGLIDGDGCFSISLTKRDVNRGICISPQVGIGMKKNDGWLLEELQKETQLGTIYYSNKEAANGICRWQTKNTPDSISLAEAVLPYLKLKKEKCRKFLKIAKFYQKTSNPRGWARVQAKGKRLRKRSEMERIIKQAVTLNYDRQTVRYRNYHGWSYWKPIIKELYPV